MYLGKGAWLAKVGSTEGLLLVIMAAGGTGAGKDQSWDAPVGPELREGPVSSRAPQAPTTPRARLCALGADPGAKMHLVRKQTLGTDRVWVLTLPPHFIALQPSADQTQCLRTVENKPRKLRN